MSPRRGLRPLAAAVAGLVAVAGDGRAQDLPAGLELGIAEVRVGRSATATLNIIVTPAGAMLVPVDTVVALTGLPVRRTDTTLAVPQVGFPTDAVLHIGRRVLAVRDTVIALREDDVVTADGVVYVLAARLGDLLQARVEADLGELAVRIVRSPPFPADRARASGAAAGPGARTARSSVPYAWSNGGAVVDWGLSTSGPRYASTTALGLRTGVAVGGGDLTIGATLARRDAFDAGTRRGAWSYRRAFGNDYVRQVLLGDVLGGGPLARPLRGATITNAEVYRDQTFSEVPVAPQLPTGWQYEVYQNGQLVGYADAATGQGVSIPLRYGSTPVQVKLVSPAGEEIVSTFMYHVPPSQLQPGRVEYAAGAGACPTSECRGVAYASVAWGARPWLTLQGGGEWRRDTVGSALAPQGAVSLAGLSGWLAQLQAMQGAFTRATFAYHGDRPYAGQLTGGVTDPSAGQPSWVAGAQRRWSVLGNGSWRREPEQRVRAWRTELRGEGRTGGAADLWRVSLLADLRASTAGVGVENDAISRERVYSASLLYLTPHTWPRVVRQTAAMGRVGADDAGRLALAEASGALPFGQFRRLGFTARWTRAYGAALQLDLSAFAQDARVLARWGVAAGRLPATSALVTGSVVGGRHGEGVEAYDLSALGRAGVSGRVFYDNDADGHFGPGDEPARGLRVAVGGVGAWTDSSGVYRGWHVAPYVVADVAVDTLEGVDPSWTPLRARSVLRPVPHMFNRTDFPLVRTHELAGRVVADTGILTSGGVTLLLTERASGTARTLQTFADGAFYLPRLRDGEYDIAVSPASLAALGAVAFPPAIPFTVRAADPTPVIELLPITLRKPYVPPQVVVVAQQPRCPNVPPGVPVDADGCPVIFREQRVITLRGVTFELNEAELTLSSIGVLTPIADAIAADTSVRVEIAGHTDGTGGRDHNLVLSAARAETVRRLFASRGVAMNRMWSRGYGPDQPVAPNATAAGRARNRRTELRRLEGEPPASQPPVEFAVQVGQFTTERAAAARAARLRAQRVDVRVVAVGRTFRLYAGRHPEYAAAKAARALLARRGLAARVVIAEPGS